MADRKPELVPNQPFPVTKEQRDNRIEDETAPAYGPRKPPTRQKHWAHAY
eukprot:SAG31_NODE_2092_length_6464_cov_3.597172_7_plen_50_part_00